MSESNSMTLGFAVLALTLCLIFNAGEKQAKLVAAELLAVFVASGIVALALSIL